MQRGYRIMTDSELKADSKAEEVLRERERMCRKRLTKLRALVSSVDGRVL